jgi:hypothetical protein
MTAALIEAARARRKACLGLPEELFIYFIY